LPALDGGALTGQLVGLIGPAPAGVEGIITDAEVGEVARAVVGTIGEVTTTADEDGTTGIGTIVLETVESGEEYAGAEVSGTHWL